MSRMAIVTAMICLSAWHSSFAARRPDWVDKRPVSAEYYIGVGRCAKKGAAADYREGAKSAALFDLASSIEVNISGEFLLKLTERSRKIEEEVRSELKSMVCTRLAGHELVSSWENAGEYWVYYRMSKSAYAARMAVERKKAVETATVLCERARGQSGNPASALRFYVQALAGLQAFADEALVAEIFSEIEILLGGMRLAPTRKNACVIVGEPVNPPLKILALQQPKAGSAAPVPNLSVSFAFTSGEGKLGDRAQTDSDGEAVCNVTAVTATNVIQTVQATVDIQALCGLEGTNAFFARLVRALSAPSATFEIRLFSPAEREKYLLWREFCGRDSVVLCACELNGKARSWSKMGDEVAAFLRSAGANVRDAGAVEPSDVMKWSAMPDGKLALPGNKTAEVVVMVVETGRLNKRKNEESPLGEDSSVAGRVKCVVVIDGKPTFSDNYEAMGGWNPMGEEMCLGIQAINVAKRLKTRYLQQVSAQ